jgi:hypothetical protein
VDTYLYHTECTPQVEGEIRNRPLWAVKMLLLDADVGRYDWGVIGCGAVLMCGLEEMKRLAGSLDSYLGSRS